ncbi:hypothetical protein HPB50_002658 [Hyalomma asiaticum]|uniref:Uncharacterized protein n=1 Tax=Hyalomma asiaticum TaxID=266040 RepID=A0ACB7RXH5_HYAAI|nr:hypothetical protein HPB50_002658 [Hyalomma asiaticum]
MVSAPLVFQMTSSLKANPTSSTLYSSTLTRSTSESTTKGVFNSLSVTASSQLTMGCGTATRPRVIPRKMALLSEPARAFHLNVVLSVYIPASLTRSDSHTAACQNVRTAAIADATQRQERRKRCHDGRRRRTPVHLYIIEEEVCS